MLGSRLDDDDDERGGRNPSPTRESAGPTRAGRSRSRSPIQKTDQRENVAMGAKNRLKLMGIQMKLNNQVKSSSAKPKLSVAAAFNQDSDDEVEEMPPEARRRMRNIGR